MGQVKEKELKSRAATAKFVKTLVLQTRLARLIPSLLIHKNMG